MPCARRPRTEGETLIEGETIYEVNISGTKKLRQRYYVAVVDGEDNNLGQVSYDALKKNGKETLTRLKILPRTGRQRY
jgi:hypothetical protein